MLMAILKMYPKSTPDDYESLDIKLRSQYQTYITLQSHSYPQLLSHRGDIHARGIKIPPL